MLLACVQRSVRGIHLELCPPGYYCIRMKYWAVAFLLNKRKMKKKQKTKEGTEIKYKWRFFLLRKLCLMSPISPPENAIWNGVYKKRCFKEPSQIVQCIYLYTFHPDSLNIIMRLLRLRIKRRAGINQTGCNASLQRFSDSTLPTPTP